MACRLLFTVLCHLWGHVAHPLTLAIMSFFFFTSLGLLKACSFCCCLRTIPFLFPRISLFFLSLLMPWLPLPWVYGDLLFLIYWGQSSAGWCERSPQCDVGFLCYISPSQLCHLHALNVTFQHPFIPVSWSAYRILLGSTGSTTSLEVTEMRLRSTCPPQPCRELKGQPWPTEPSRVFCCLAPQSLLITQMASLWYSHIYTKYPLINHPCYFPFLISPPFPSFFPPMMAGLQGTLVPGWGLDCLNLFPNWPTGGIGCVK